MPSVKRMNSKVRKTKGTASKTKGQKTAKQKAPAAKKGWGKAKIV